MDDVFTVKCNLSFGPPLFDFDAIAILHTMLLNCNFVLSLPPTHLENTSTTTNLSSASLIQVGEFDFVD